MTDFQFTGFCFELTNHASNHAAIHNSIPAAIHNSNHNHSNIEFDIGLSHDAGFVYLFWRSRCSSPIQQAAPQSTGAFHRLISADKQKSFFFKSTICLELDLFSWLWLDCGRTQRLLILGYWPLRRIPHRAGPRLESKFWTNFLTDRFEFNLCRTSKSLLKLRI